MVSSFWLEGLMLVVTLITIEVGCISFSWLSAFRPLGRDEMTVNNYMEADRGKLNVQYIVFAKHLGESWAGTGVCEGVCDCLAALAVGLEKGVYWSSAADNSPSGPGLYSGTCSENCKCIWSKFSQANKRLLGRNCRSVKHYVSNSLNLSAVRSKAQSNRAMRKIKEAVPKPIRTIENVSSFNPWLNRKWVKSNLIQELKWKTCSWKSTGLLTHLFGIFEISPGHGDGNLCQRTTVIIFPWHLWKVTSQ